jgi:hypothetical protein
MSDQLISGAIAALKQRALGEGGFANADQGNYRTDATAWAILALTAGGAEPELVHLARQRLVASQLPEGRVCISPEHPEVYWPTSLAILAWHKSPAQQAALSRASQFLLNSSGIVFEPTAKGPDEHNPSLKGWPWVAGTYAWIDPTALGMIALKATGQGSHPRVQEAGRLILDRQCLHGGWNYGNRLVYGAELRPMPENTGLALDALAGLTPKASLETSINYLQTRVQGLKTPLALAFSLLGLGAWGERPAAAPSWLAECWQLQDQLGGYDTTAIALFILAASLSGGLGSIFGQEHYPPPG